MNNMPKSFDFKISLILDAVLIALEKAEMNKDSVTDDLRMIKGQLESYVWDE